MTDASTEAHPHRLRFPGTLEGFAGAATELRRLLDARPVSGGPRFNVELAFEEIAVNIVRHGSPRSDIHVTVDVGRDEIVLVFEDDGIPFDPRDRPAPAPPDSLDEAQVGGLGVSLVTAVASRLDYARTADGKNRLTVAIAADD